MPCRVLRQPGKTITEYTINYFGPFLQVWADVTDFINSKKGRPNMAKKTDVVPEIAETVDPMKVEIKGKRIIIDMPLCTDESGKVKPMPSSSGKTLVVAKTGRNVETSTKIAGKNIWFGGTAYIYPDKQVVAGYSSIQILNPALYFK